MRRFEGRTAFISGGSRGIGFACAHRLASEGADVFLAAANEENLTIATKKIEKDTGRTVGTHASDLSLLAGCEAAADSALAFGTIDILVNCAGATKGGIFPGQPDEEMIDGFALKFHGAVRLSRFLWPSLKKLHGNVVNISGGFARTPDADFMVGGAVNAALANFSKALAAKGLEDDVNVNWVHPGLTVTDRMKTIFTDRAIQQNKSREVVEAERVKEEGLRRLGQPEDVATVVAFLCSAEARHIHGSAVTVDGGGSKGYY
jgi:3-oxoacyl-[acyl-carrier protein] reductase